PTIGAIAGETGATVEEAARIHFEIAHRLRLDDLAARGAAIATADRFDRLAIAKALDQIAAAHTRFTRPALRAGGTERWLAAQGDRPARVERIFEEAAGHGAALTLSRLAVAAAALADLAGGKV